MLWWNCNYTCTATNPAAGREKLRMRPSCCVVSLQWFIRRGKWMLRGQLPVQPFSLPSPEPWLGGDFQHRLLTTKNELKAAAAAAKSLQSCPTLCDPIDGSPPGSPIPGILQARTLEWVASSFFSAWKWKVKVKSLSSVWLLETPWTAAYQAPLSMGFSRQEYWSGVPLPSPELKATHTLIMKLASGPKNLLPISSRPFYGLLFFPPHFFSIQLRWTLHSLKFFL